MTPSGRPAVLYLVHRVPFPPDKGDRIRTYQFLRYLAKRCDLYLACLADEAVQDHALHHLRGLCRDLAVVKNQGPSRWLRIARSLVCGKTASEGAFWSAELADVLRAWMRSVRFDAVLASASSLAPYLDLNEFTGTRQVVDLIDVDSQKWLDYASSSRGPKARLYQLEGRRLARLENKLALSSEALVLISSAEKAIFRRSCSTGQVAVIGNGVDLDFFRPEPQPDAQGCVFLGALDYWPNIEGLVWFCEHVWPTVYRQRPTTTFSLVGRRPTAAVISLGKIPGVKVVGQVPDVRPHVAAAAVSVAPLRIARGVQNKVLESLAMGKPTVVSPHALEGLKAEPGVHLLAAATPDEWIQTLVSLLDDSKRRQELAINGRCYVQEHHRWEHCLRPLDKLLALPTRPLTRRNLWDVHRPRAKAGVSSPDAVPHG